MFDSQTNLVVLPALIGAGSAVITFLIKDIILYEIREARQRRRELLDRKLSKLYGPIYIAMRAGEGMISNILTEQRTFEAFTANFHLLHPDLQELASEFIRLIRGDLRKPGFTSDDEAKTAVALSKRFSTRLGEEMTFLRDQYLGRMWRLRRLCRRLISVGTESF